MISNNYIINKFRKPNVFNYKKYIEITLIISFSIFYPINVGTDYQYEEIWLIFIAMQFKSLDKLKLVLKGTL